MTKFKAHLNQVTAESLELSTTPVVIAAKSDKRLEKLANVRDAGVCVEWQV